MDAKDRYGWFTLGFFLHLILIYVFLSKIVFEKHVGFGIALAIYISLALILLFPFVSSHNKLRESYRVRFVRGLALSVVSVLLITLGFFLGNISENTTPSLDFNEYDFKIYSSPPEQNELEFAQLNYNFGSQTGEVSFYLKSTTSNLSNHSIELRLPDELVVNSFLVRRSDDADVHLNDSILFINKSKTTYFLTFGDLDVKRAKVTFSLSGYMVPNGKFNILFFAKKSWNVDRDMIKFNLGDYKCNYACFTESRNAEINLNNEEVVVRFPNTYYQNVTGFKSLPIEFVLNTYSGAAEQKKNSYNNLSTALSVGGLIMFGEVFVIFYLLYVHPRKYRSKKKKSK